MKKFYILFLGVMFIMGCSEEQPIEDFEQPTPQKIDFDISSSAFQSKFVISSSVLCQSTDLIAGQNEVAGTVEVFVDGEVLSVVYTTNSQWTLDETHMSIGNCTDDIPTTGSGNPKIGHFEYSAYHDAGTTVVTYTTNSTELPVETCVAAHAVVSRTAGGNETAWGYGPEFPGRSWATYTEIDLSLCSSNHGGGGGLDSDPNPGSDPTPDPGSGDDVPIAR